MRRTKCNVDEGDIARISQIVGGMGSKTDVSLAYVQTDATDLREPKANE